MIMECCPSAVVARSARWRPGGRDAEMNDSSERNHERTELAHGPEPGHGLRRAALDEGDFVEFGLNALIVYRRRDIEPPR